MNFAAFQFWRTELLATNPGLLDCAETNLYCSLAELQPKPATSNADNPVYRCDLARAWLTRYCFPAEHSRRALVCRGVRHALALMFAELARCHSNLWIPRDVYPVYAELAETAGIKPRFYPTLPAPVMPATDPGGDPEYMLVTNPWKPLGRYLTDKECNEMVNWLNASPRRHLLVDCVYDLNVPFHDTTKLLHNTGRAILLHSVTKGWLWPKTFGVALIGEDHATFESAFRKDSPSLDQLRLAQQLLSTGKNCPNQVIVALQSRAKILFGALPDPVCKMLLSDPACISPSCYFFPVKIGVEELLKQYHLLAIPASAFGGDWEGSILTSLSPVFGPNKNGGMP